MSKTRYRLFYREKKRPDNMREGRSLSSEKAASATAEWHNAQFKRFHHWYEADEDAQ